MRIAYVAKHDSGGNDDEGCICHALQELGHEVCRLRENKGRKAHRLWHCDFLLFHKWFDVEALVQVRIPRVFWYFDLVDYPVDPTLSVRCQQRKSWMEQILPHVDLGFCTDGDWVANDTTSKLVWLPQGADSRIAGLRQAPRRQWIIFSGIGKGGGQQRMSFVKDMRRHYGSRFLHVQGHYRESLAQIISNAQICVAPDSPVTDLYWSNRVYMTLGFGGFLLHPYCKLLSEHYQDREEIVFYRSRSELYELISYYLDRPEERLRIQRAGLQRTLRQHTYRHRCLELTRIVQERVLKIREQP